MAYEKDPNEIDALWQRTSARGTEMLSGTVNGVEVICFRTKSDNPKAPAWRVLKSQPKGEAKPFSARDVDFD